jgi:hypothetical protein
MAAIGSYGCNRQQWVRAFADVPRAVIERCQASKFMTARNAVISC